MYNGATALLSAKYACLNLSGVSLQAVESFSDYRMYRTQEVPRKMSLRSNSNKTDGLLLSILRRIRSPEADDISWNYNSSSKSRCLFSKKHKLLFSISTVFFIFQTTLFGLAQGSIQGYDAQLKFQKFSANLSDSITTMSWLQFMDNDAKELNDIARLRRRRDDSGSSSAESSGDSGVNETTTPGGSGMGEESTTSNIGPTTTIYVTTSFNSETTGSELNETTVSGEGGTSPGMVTMTTKGSGIEESTGSTTVTSEAVTIETTGTTSIDGSGFEETTTVSSEVVTSESTGTTSTEGSGFEETTTVTSEAATTERTSTTSTEGSGFEETTTVMSEVVTTERSSTTSTEGSGFEETTAEETTTTTEGETTTGPGSICDTCVTNEYCISDISGEDRCACEPGFTLDDAGTCTAVKQFGGKLHMNETFDPDLENSSSGLYLSTVDVYVELLLIVYGSESWFISVAIEGFSSGSTVVEYILTTRDDDSVNSSTIEAAFRSFLKNTTYFDNCSCSVADCPPKNLNVTSSVLAPASCDDAGTAGDIVCSSRNVSSYCDANSTTCSADDEGEVVCECKDGFTTTTNSTRICAVEIVCTANSGCNSPFGTCLATTNGAGICACMWGFQGTNCQEVWLFVLVIVLSALVFIALVVGGVCLCKKKRKGNGWSGISYGNDSIFAPQDRYRSLSDWDLPVQGVVPTYVYDDLSPGNDDANNGNENKAYDVAQLPVQQWRVSELSNGERIRSQDVRASLATANDGVKDSDENRNGAHGGQQLPVQQWRASELNNGERIRPHEMLYFHNLDGENHSGDKTGVEPEDITTRV